MGKVLLLVACVLILTSLTAAAGAYGINGSEPAFLRGIGPQAERADSLLAAAVVAVAVAAVIARGLHRHGTTARDSSR